VPDACLAAENISVIYGKGAARAVALENASAKFEPGQITLLMGASGSGKTTLLSTLGCIRKPDKGSVRFLGRDLALAREPELARLRRHEIGFVFQFFRLFRSLTALENVAIGLEISGRRGAYLRTAEQALESVGVAAKAHHRPEEMSGGERQRVAIARALVKDPRVLLADEPTAALDSATGSQVAEMIQRAVKQRGMVGVIATHDARLVPFADRVIELRDGRLFDGSEGVL
jgi:putative ABC transport system ATP-binding protein